MRSTRASIPGRFFLLVSLCWTSMNWSAAAARAADVIRIEVEFFDGDHETPTNRATVWTSERRVRIEQHAPGESTPGPVFLYRGDQDLLLSVSESARSYVKIERRMLSLLGSGRRTARREVEGQLDPLPPDQQPHVADQTSAPGVLRRIHFCHLLHSLGFLRQDRKKSGQVIALPQSFPGVGLQLFLHRDQVLSRR